MAVFLDDDTSCNSFNPTSSFPWLFHQLAFPVPGLPKSRPNCARLLTTPGCSSAGCRRPTVYRPVTQVILSDASFPLDPRSIPSPLLFTACSEGSQSQCQRHSVRTRRWYACVDVGEKRLTWVPQPPHICGHPQIRHSNLGESFAFQQLKAARQKGSDIWRGCCKRHQKCDKAASEMISPHSLSCEPVAWPNHWQASYAPLCRATLISMKCAAPRSVPLRSPSDDPNFWAASKCVL
eukprot:356652-Chlamydomonas_euryale.AAC.5